MTGETQDARKVCRAGQAAMAEEPGGVAGMEAGRDQRTEYRAAVSVDRTAVLTVPSRGKALLALAFCCLLSGSTCAHSTALGLSIQKKSLGEDRPARTARQKVLVQQGRW